MKTSLLLAAALGLGALGGCDDGDARPPAPDAAIEDAGADAAPDLAPPPDATLAAVQITAPADGEVVDGAADLDGDLSNGVQIEARADAVGADDGRVVFRLAEQVAEAPLIEGRAVAVLTLPASDEATLRLTAEVVAGGRAVADAVTVTVRVRTCALTVAPLPGGGACDAGPADDLDPERPGVQLELRAQTDCARVEATVGGAPIAAEVIDGAATLPVTLGEGETTVEVSAHAPGVRAARVGPLVYRARPTPPVVRLDLRDAGETARGLAAAVVEGERAYWTFTGEAVGVAPGEAVSVLFVPPIDDAPREARVGADGRFTVEVPGALGAVWVGEVALAATDACGSLGPAATYRLRLDAVTPRLHIATPPDGVRLIPADDVDPARPDIQVPVTVEVDDPREGVDYRISVACGPPGAPRTDRALTPDDATTRAAGEPVIVTIRAEERGELVCVPLAAPAPNPIDGREALYRLFFETPRFVVEAPAIDAGCLDGVVRVEGRGALLDGNQPALTVTPFDAEGTPRAPVPLAAVGDGRYAADLGRADLPDGRWTLRVEGTVFGRVPVEVVPAAITVEVDREQPTARFVAPEAVPVDVDPATPGTQFTPRVEVCGAAGETLTLALEPALGGPYDAAVPAGDCAVVTLPTVTAPLGEVQLEARVADTCGNLTVVTRRTGLDPADVGARIIDPADGAAISAGLDADPQAPGCQLDLDALVTGPGADAAVSVCTTVAQGEPDAACDGRSSALIGPCAITGVAEGGSTLRCPISLADGTHTLTLAVDGGALTSPPVRVVVDCAPPTVDAISVDGGEDGCVNRAERLNAGEAGQSARVRVRFATTGLDPTTPLRVRTDGGLDLGGTTAGAGEAIVTLPPGAHRLYLRGQDAAGNALPEDERATRVAVEVDTAPPTPSIAALVEGACLAADDDADPAAGGLQTTLRVRTGDAAGALAGVTVTVDGALAAEGEGADLVALPLSLADGDRRVEAAVRDACGNVGRAAVAVRVDTIAPAPALLGLEAGAMFDADDDADGDPTSGFQLDVLVALDAAEPGQIVEIDADDDPVRTDPSPLIVDDLDPTPARLTLSGGARALVARATDACGNTGASEPIAITIDLPGCPSRITTPAGALGEDDLGDVDLGAGTGTTSVEGRVELLDLDCRGAPVTLLLDGAPAGEAAVGVDGSVRFDGVTLSHGAHTVALRVGPVREISLDSPTVEVVADLYRPLAQIVVPHVSDAPALVGDVRPDEPGQQLEVQVEVREQAPVTARQVALFVDDVEVATADVDGERAVFAAVTFTPGAHMVRACARDRVNTGGCDELLVNVDAGPPAAIDPITVDVVDPRRTVVDLRFTAPGDDGADGRVDHYAVRSAAAPIQDEAAWAAARSTEVTFGRDLVAAGAEQTLRFEGPGPRLADGLALGRVHHLAIRAYDELALPSPITPVTVDLRLTLDTGAIPAASPWEAGVLLNTTSPVIGVGDLDGDGYDDVLVTATQSAGATGAAFVFGGPAPATRALVRGPRMTTDFFGVAAAAAGDLNGDGAPDVAVQGYLSGYTATAVVIYFGCATLPCDRAALVAPDAMIVTDGGRFTNSLAGVGDVGGIDDAGYDDLLVGGGFDGDDTAFVVTGRVVWPALPEAVVLSDDPGARSPGVATISLPSSPAGVYAAGLGDLDGDGWDDIALSAGPAIDESYVVYGGFGEAIAADDPRVVRLVDPCGQANPTFGTAFAGGQDLDGDARPDLVVGNRANKRVVVFDADLEPLDCFGRSPSGFGRVLDLAGDIDGDGAVDLVATHGDPLVTDAWVFLNDGRGHFGADAVVSPRAAHVRLDTPARRKLGVAGVGDFDGDGHDDLAAIYLSAAGEMTWVVYR